MYLDSGEGILATLGIKGGITLGSMGTRGSRIFFKTPHISPADLEGVNALIIISQESLKNVMTVPRD